MDLRIARLKRNFLRHRTVTLLTAEETPDLTIDEVSAMAGAPYRLTLAVDTTGVPIEQVVTATLQRLNVRDLSVDNPPLKDVNPAIYRGEIEGTRSSERRADGVPVGLQCSQGGAGKKVSGYEIFSVVWSADESFTSARRSSFWAPKAVQISSP